MSSLGGDLFALLTVGIHRLMVLFFQAKERELELKNSWAENKLTRRQTQAKYGF